MIMNHKQTTVEPGVQAESAARVKEELHQDSQNDPALYTYDGMLDVEQNLAGQSTRAADHQEDADISYLPMPPSSDPERTLADADPELYAAWRNHIKQGFANNQTMFDQLLNGFMNPYWTTVWMYRILFGLGVGAFVVAGILGILGESTAAIATFGGLSVVYFLAYFISQPLRALEENLQFITWLGIIYNSYWTRIAYITKLDTVQTEIEAVTTDTIAKLDALVTKQTAQSDRRNAIGR